MAFNKFVTADDFYQYWGIDLNSRLRDGDDTNDSSKADIFLGRLEKRVMSWIDKNSFRVVPWNNLSEFQLDMFKCALLEQAMYMWRNGDIDMDSGYDQSSGLVIDPNTKASLVMCEPAINFLITSGIMNQKITNRKRFMSGDTFGVFETRPKEINGDIGTGVTEPESEQN